MTQDDIDWLDDFLDYTKNIPLNGDDLVAQLRRVASKKLKLSQADIDRYLRSKELIN